MWPNPPKRLITEFSPCPSLNSPRFLKRFWNVSKTFLMLTFATFLKHFRNAFATFAELFYSTFQKRFRNLSKKKYSGKKLFSPKICIYQKNLNNKICFELMIFHYNTWIYFQIFIKIFHSLEKFSKKISVLKG